VPHGAYPALMAACLVAKQSRCSGFIPELMACAGVWNFLLFVLPTTAAPVISPGQGQDTGPTVAVAVGRAVAVAGFRVTVAVAFLVAVAVGRLVAVTTLVQVGAGPVLVAVRVALGVQVGTGVQVAVAVAGTGDGGITLGTTTGALERAAGVAVLVEPHASSTAGRHRNRISLATALAT
jgi:hypothetical protein